MMERKALAKCRAILAFGPVTETAGMRPGTFYQATIDPAMVSPGGDFIRFGSHEGDEIHGWQRIDAMTVCEVLAEAAPDGSYPPSDNKPEPLEMMVLV